MSQSEITLDRIDLKILQVLQENGRLSNVELSERVALSPSPCLRRLKHYPALCRVTFACVPALGFAGHYPCEYG